MFFRLITYIQRNFPSTNSPLVQLSLFHDKRGPVWSTVKQITDQLKEAKIDYAVIGGLAVYEHGYRRSTNDCDLLLTKAGLQHFHEKLVGRYVVPKSPGARKKFICNDTKTQINIIVQGDRPGDGKETPVEFPDPATSTQIIDEYSVITLAKLIELKLAAFKRLPANRIQDKADVTQLIQANNLDRSFSDFLHVYVKNEFTEIIDILEKEREQKGDIDEI